MKYLVVVYCLISFNAWSQNFIVNGEFDQNVDQWDNSYGLISWVSDDGATNSGSLEIKDNFNNGGSAASANINVIEVQSNTTYQVSAAVKIMPNTEAQGAVLFIRWLDDNQNHVGYTDYLHSNESIENGNWHILRDDFVPPEGMHFAQLMVGVTGSSGGSTEFAVARWDDVRFEVAGNDYFAIVAGHSGSWYNPQQSGHGLNIEILDDNRVLVYWYVYDNQGHSMWLIASGSHDGREMFLEVSQVTGAMFPPNFRPNDINVTPWGQFYLQFSGCHSGVFKWIPAVNSNFNAGEMEISRLTQIKGLYCSE
jgi:hypothetical protein